MKHSNKRGTGNDTPMAEEPVVSMSLSKYNEQIEKVKHLNGIIYSLEKVWIEAGRVVKFNFDGDWIFDDLKELLEEVNEDLDYYKEKLK